MLPKVLRPYAKAVVAFFALSAVFFFARMGMKYPTLDAFLIDLFMHELLSALGTWGVYRVRNTPVPPKGPRK